MIFDTRSSYMLKYEKARSKLIEFNIDKINYPHFPLNSDDLTYSTLYALSLYCEELIDKPDSIELPELFNNLTFVSQYYDSTLKTNNRQEYNNIFHLLGATTYFLSENFGSAKVLIEQINEWNIKNEVMTLLYYTLLFFLKIDRLEISSKNKITINYIDSLKKHFLCGETQDNIFKVLIKMRKIIYTYANQYSVNYIDFLYAVVICAIKHSSWILLPKYSNWNLEIWKPLLISSGNLKILWPAQKVIVEAGVLKDKNLVVPLPTGVGKTKSIEIILRSKFIEQGTYIAVIIAPLKALCNEIISELIPSFANEAIVNQLTDAAQEDFNLEIISNNKYIFICTPEKFTYILRHDPGFLSIINLYIFDEAHLLDDDHRGAQYELMMAEILHNRNINAQMILFSAVLSNAKEISTWLFKNDTSIIDHSLVKSTEKSIGFHSSDQTIHFYEKDNMDEESFYIPKSIEYTRLKYNTTFPKENPQDISIYYANKLCTQGGIAIYAGQVKSIIPIMRRILQVKKNGLDLTNMIKNGNIEEINKLAWLISLHYGKNSELTLASKLGALPHYADLPNGIKMAIEYALRKKHFYFVVCTTTLAEGVNIPLKYLFFTTFRYGNNKIQIRKIQNLIGRTARAGLYTEGSTIVTDSKFYINRNTSSSGGKYRWAECKRMFDYQNSEACESSILSLVNDIYIDYKYRYNGQALSTYLIENYGSESCYFILQEKIRKLYKEKVSDKEFKNYSIEIDKKINKIKQVIETIENYLCYLYDSMNEKELFLEATDELTQSTYAYHLASDEKQKYLTTIFNLIAKNIIEKIEPEHSSYYAKSLYGIEISKKIFLWTNQNIESLKDYSIEDILEEIIIFFLDLFKNQLSINDSTFVNITNMWISGKTYIEIFYEINIETIKLNHIEKICSKTISFYLSFLIGNIIDVISTPVEELNEKLKFLQKQIKHGVPTRLQILICENIFDEKIIANRIESTFEQIYVDDNNFKEFIISEQKEILKILKEFPEYFGHKFRLYLKSIDK